MADFALDDLARLFGIGTSIAGTATAVAGKELGVTAARIRGEGAAVSTKGQLDAAQFGADAAVAQSKQAGINADLLSSEVDLSKLATDATYAKGVFDENNFRFKLSRILATEQAGFGARHIDPTTGSPLLMQGFTAAQGEVDARLIRANAQKDASDTMMQTASLSNAAASARATQLAALMKANQILTAGIDAGEAGVFSQQAAAIEGEAAHIGATTELLSGASKVWQGLQGNKSTAGKIT